VSGQQESVADNTDTRHVSSQIRCMHACNPRSDFYVVSRLGTWNLQPASRSPYPLHTTRIAWNLQLHFMSSELCTNNKPRRLRLRHVGL